MKNSVIKNSAYLICLFIADAHAAQRDLVAFHKRANRFELRVKALQLLNVAYITTSVLKECPTRDAKVVTFLTAATLSYILQEFASPMDLRHNLVCLADKLTYPATHNHYKLQRKYALTRGALIEEQNNAMISIFATTCLTDVGYQILTGEYNAPICVTCHLIVTGIKILNGIFVRSPKLHTNGKLPF